VIDPFVASPANAAGPGPIDTNASVAETTKQHIQEGAALVVTTSSDSTNPTFVVAKPTVPTNLDLTLSQMPGQSPLFLFMVPIRI